MPLIAIFVNQLSLLLTGLKYQASTINNSPLSFNLKFSILHRFYSSAHRLNDYMVLIGSFSSHLIDS